MKLIEIQDIIKVAKLNLFGGRKIAQLIMAAFKFNTINALYEKHQNKTGIDFIKAILRDTGIKYEVNEPDINKIPTQGAFIIVSNHPYGGIEGLVLANALHHVRPDLKIMANFLFHKIEPLKEIIFPVNPFEGFKGASSMRGMKDALAYLEAGHPILIFPAGEVSTYQAEYAGITDKKWSNSAIKFIKKAKVPIVPIHFSGSNSNAFHLLGMVHPSLRTAMLPSEMLNKKKKSIQIRIGSPISINEQDKFENIARYGRYLRAKTYSLNTQEEIKGFFFSTFHQTQKAEEIIERIGVNYLQNDIANLPASCKLFTHQKYEVYCTPSHLIPNIINEIGRLREITFREIGEGTNHQIDLDEYDLFYQHLFIWDTESKSITGAYRLGKGKEIMQQYGPKGFYIRSLFKFKREFITLFNESIELGRSFIVKEQQKNPQSLFLLWKGIMYFLIKNPEYRYLIGPVSISNRYSRLSKTLIIDYIRKNHYDSLLGQFVKPRKRFSVHIPDLDTDILTASADLISLDRIINDIEQDGYKIPVLLKKYIQLNGKILCFNIDPKFNDSLDGLLLLDYYDIPEETTKYLSRDFEPDEILLRIAKPVNGVARERAEKLAFN